MTTAGLFRLFGGRENVMDVCGVSRNAINHWLKTGVPYRHWPVIREAARDAGIPGVTDAALASTRLRRSRQPVSE